MEHHHGKILRRFMKVNSMTVESVARLMGVSRQAVYNWFEKQVFEDFLIEKFSEKGGIQKSTFVNNLDATKSNDRVDTLKDQLIESLSREIQTLRNLIKGKDEIIDAIMEGQPSLYKGTMTIKKREESVVAKKDNRK